MPLALPLFLLDSTLWMTWWQEKPLSEVISGLISPLNKSPLKKRANEVESLESQGGELSGQSLFREQL